MPEGRWVGEALRLVDGTSIHKWRVQALSGELAGKARYRR